MLNPQLYIYSDSIFTKRGSGVAFNRNNEDYIDFGTGKAWIDSTDFTIEVKISNYIDVESGIIGQSALGAGRWSISRGGVGGMVFVLGTDPSQFHLQMPFISDGIIKIIGLNGNYEMYLNDVLMDTHSATVTSINTSYKMTVASFNIDGTTPGLFATGTVHWAKITSFGVTNTLLLNEGSGDTVTWSEGDTGTIKTSNSLGINYINDTMWKLKIVEESGFVDVEIFEEDNVVLTSSVQNIKDISKIFTDFTKSFTVPASPANNKIFQHWYKAEIEGGFNANLRKNATMELNLQPFKTGKIQLNKVQKKNGVAVNYKLQFFGDVVQITDLFGEDLLTDLDLSSNAHDFTSANVELGITGAGLDSGEVIYPLISSGKTWEWGTTTDTATVSDIKWKTGVSYGLEWDELKPAIKIQKIFDAIRVKYGLVFSDHFINSSDFRRLYIWASKDKGLMTPFGEPVLMVYDDNVGSDDGQSWFTILGTWPHGQVIAEFIPDAGYEEVEYSITKSVNGVQTTTTHTGNSSSAEFQQGGTGQSDKTVGFYISASQSFHFTSNVNLLDVPTNHFDGSATTQSVTGKVYFTDTVVDGVTKLGELPEMKVVDFFRGIVQMFNLVVVPNGDEFIVQTLDDWYAAGTTKDFSKYIDLAEENVNRTDLYKVINFTYQEPETIIQDAFEDTNDRFYGDLEYESDVDAGTFKIELPYENLAFSLLNDENGVITNIHVGYALDKDLEAIKLKPLLFYIIDTTTPQDDIGFIDDAGALNALTDYNNVGQENGDDTSNITHSLNWGSEISSFNLGTITNSLFADYWSTYITDIFDENRRMFKFSGIIPSGVLSNLKLNDKLIINGRRYIINQYTANLKTGKVDFELLNDVLELDAVETNNDGLQYELQTGLTG